MLRNAEWGGQHSRTNCYEDVQFNIISVTRRWVGVKYPGEKRYVTRLEWPLTCCELDMKKR